MKKILKNTEIRIFFTVWLVYLLFMSGYGGNWTADSMLSLTLSIVDDHTFFIDKYVKGNEDNAFFNGHFYSGVAPGASFLAVPSYFIFKPLFGLIPHGFLGYPEHQLRLIFLNIIATIFVTSLLAALTSVLVYKLLDNFTKKKSIKLLITFIFSFATLYFLYATTFDAKINSTFFAFFAFYILFNMKKNKTYKNSYLFYAGLLLGFSVAIEYSQVILLFLLFLYLLKFLRDRRIIFFIIGVLIPLLFVLAYHQAVFGNPFTTPYMHRASEYVTEVYKEGAGIPTLYNLYELSFSPFRGFFFYMPIMLMSIYGLYRGFKLKKYNIELLLILLLFIAFIFYNASFKSDLVRSGGCSFGPRYMILLLPFMILPLAFIVDKVGRFLVLVLGFLSFLINLLPNLYGVTHLWTYKCLEPNPLSFYFPFILERGFTNYTLNLFVEKVSLIPTYLINILAISGLLVLFFVVWLIWKN